jgi:hypothetical protein
LKERENFEDKGTDQRTISDRWMLYVNWIYMYEGSVQRLIFVKCKGNLSFTESWGLLD